MPDVPLLPACRDPRLLGAVPFYPRQLDLLDAIARHRTTIVSAGRRSGKSRIAAAVGVHSLLLCDELDRFIPSHEPRYVVCVANSEEQARIVLDLARALVKASPVLVGELVSETQTELVFRRERVLRVLPCNARTIRGLPASVVALDELGHFFTETWGQQTGEKVWQALTPSIAQFGAAGKILATSTPGGDAGLFESLFLRAESGELENAVAFTAATREMNLGIEERFLREQEAALGPDSFAREFEGRFVSGGGRFFEPDEVRAVVARRKEALPEDGRAWMCAIDPSSGGGDPFACVVVGRDARSGYEGRLLVGHVERWQPRRSPRLPLSRRTRAERDLWVDAVLDRVAAIAKRFGAQVVSDQHVPGVVLDELRKRGVARVRIVPWTAATRTEAFQALRARVATERIDLVQDEQLVAELLRVRNRFRAGSSLVEVPRVGDSHGDLVMALAAGVFALDRHGVSVGPARVSSPANRRIELPTRWRQGLERRLPQTVEELAAGAGLRVYDGGGWSERMSDDERRR